MITSPRLGRNLYQGGQIMPKNKNKQETDSRGAMGNKPDREFESQGQNPSSGKGDLGHKAGSFKKGAGSPETDDDEMMTSGGRKGNFSDKDRESENQWSPGSNQSSDR